MFNSIPRFSIEKHYKKLEKVTEEIVKSRKQNDYTIVFWLLEDGLKINSDGTTKWIKRWVEEEIKDSTELEICSDTKINYEMHRGIGELERGIQMCCAEQNVSKQFYMNNDYILNAWKGTGL